MANDTLNHRTAAFEGLSGRGLEIGALHEPCRLSARCQVEYFDVVTEEQARALFPEIQADAFVHVQHTGDLDGDGLAFFADSQFDFVIMNHVLEHLANPLLAVREIFRILRPGGAAVIAIPDMRFTFDWQRKLTEWEHLWSDYENRVRVSSDEHYIDFLRSAAPHVFAEPPENLPIHIARVRTRREHSHVWTSQSFRKHLLRSMAAFGISASPVFESFADDNQIEYFSIWRKDGPAARP